jgi:L-ribulose-5-phosphate 4-epimerase
MNKFFTKKKIIKLSKKLLKLNLQFLNFGNLSIRVGNLCFIKPSGVNIYKIKYNDVSVVDIKTNKHLTGKKPSVDTPTHIELYKKYPLIKSIVHTHSKYGTIWAQSLKPVPCYGTTHADFFLKNIPITKVLTKKQISNNYEKEIGLSIIQTVKDKDILQLPGILIANHGVYSWGKDPNSTLNNALIIEIVCEMAFNTRLINKKVKPIKKILNKKHFFRKNGPNSYYGQ